MKIAHYLGTRDNNFNLLRFIAASLVLISHSYPLAVQGLAEPLRESLGTTWGSIAVDIFFVTSGFLVTRSLMHKRDLREFALARALRIFPALFVAMLITVVVVGIWFTKLDAAEYWQHKQTWKYLFKNTFLFRGIEWGLPGTLVGHHGQAEGAALNGSLWTLPVEVTMYVLLAVLFAAVSFFWRGKDDAMRSRVLGIVITAIAVTAGVANVILNAYPDAGRELSLLAMFFAGGALYVFRDAVSLRWDGFLVLLAAVLLSTLAGARLFNVVYFLLVPYLVLFIAFVPGGAIRQFNLVGDYSYGVYIYAFTVQQLLASQWVGITPVQMMVVSMAITLVLAALSWHLIEKRALGFKDRLLAHHALANKLQGGAVQHVAGLVGVAFCAAMLLNSSWVLTTVKPFLARLL